MVTTRETLAGAYNALFTLPLLFLALLAAKAALMVGFLFCALLSLLVVCYALEYGHYLNRNSFYVMFETNRAESADFFKKIAKFDPPRALFLLATIVLGLLLGLLLPKAHTGHLLTWLGTGTLVILLSLLIPSLRRIFTGRPYFTADGIQYEWKSAFQNLFVLLGTSYFEYQRENRRQHQLANLCPQDIEAVQTPAERPAQEVHVLIIGESAVRSHMGLYGYFRPTTPGLDNLSRELYRFDEVISSHSGTIASIRDMFTFCSYEDQSDYYDRGTLLQYVRKAGYDTAWISNQCPTGYNENFASMLARTCDTHTFLNPSQHYVFPSHDDQVLQPLKTYLHREGTPRKFVVVHLMGQHFSFANRYPEQFARFQETTDLEGCRGVLDQINAYDNATLFNDHVVTSIIETVKGMQAHASVLYLADHGIDLFEYSDTASQS